MALNEFEIEEANVDINSPNLDVAQNVDVSQTPDASMEASAATEQAAAPPPVEVPKTPRQKSDELFTRVLMARDKDINNMLNKYGRDKFFKLITENKQFREDFYQDISNRGIKIPINEYKGYYTPTYEKQKDVVLSEDYIKQEREKTKAQQQTAQQQKREQQAAKNQPWYRELSDTVSYIGGHLGNALKQLTVGATEIAQKSDIARALKIDKAFDILTDATTNAMRGSAFGEAVNETDLPRLAGGYTGFDFDRIAQQMKDVKSYGSTNIEKDFEKHEGAWDTFTDWAKMIGPTVIESFATLTRSGWEEMVASSAMGAPEVGALMGAYHMELFATIVDELEKAKYDVTNGNDWREAFNNKEFIGPVLKKANTRAAIITGVDFIAAGAGSSLFGNLGKGVSNLARKVVKAAPDALTSPVARGIALAGKARKVLDYAPIQAVGQKIASTSARIAAKPLVQKAGKAAGEFFNPREVIGAGVGEAAAQYVTSPTGEIDVESTALEVAPEFGYIKVLSKLLKRGRGRYTSPTDDVAEPTAQDEIIDLPPTVVTQEEYDEYQKTKKLDPERFVAVETDAKKALSDPAFLAKLKKEADEDESMRFYLDFVTDEMHTQTKQKEAETIMKAAIAHVAERNGGMSEDEIADKINPESPQFDKKLSQSVESKYSELMDMYAAESGQTDLRQTPTTTTTTTAPAPSGPTFTTSTAPDTQKLPVEVRKSLDAIQRLQEYMQRMEAAVPNMTPEQLRQHEARKKSVEEVIEKNKQILNRLGYDSENISGIPSEVGVGQESQQTQPEQGGGTQEAGGSGVLQTPGQEVVSPAPAPEAPVAITDDIRALAAQELSPKNLVKEGKLVYKNRKPVYNGQEFKNTRELEAYLKTDEAILAAAESNENIANALGKTPTFTPTTTTGVEQQPTTGEAGTATESMAGVQTAEGTAETGPVEPVAEKGKGEEVLPEGVGTEKPIHTVTDSKGRVSKFFPKKSTKDDGLTVTTFEFERSDKGTERISAVNGVPSDVAFGDKWQIDNSQIPEGAKVAGVTELRETSDGKGTATVMFEADGNKFTGEVTLNQRGKPEGKPRVKGDTQEVLEAFEKAVAAGKKISFPVSGGRTTVQLDKPGQLKANAAGELYIDGGKGRRDYLPAGGSEESVIRQQLGVAETPESQKQRKEAIAERNKKTDEQYEQKKKAEQEKQTKQKRDYIARLQKVLDTGKDEKGNPLNQRQRKEVEKTIERLKAAIAEAEGKPAATEQKAEPEKQPKTKAQEKLQRIIDGLPKGRKGTFIIAGDDGGPKIGDKHNTGNTVLITESILASNFDPKIADNDGDGVEVYEMIREYGERENGKLSKAPVVRVMIFNNKEDADAFFKEREAKNEKRIKELQEEVDKEKAETNPEGKKETEKPSGMPKEIQEAYTRRSTLTLTEQALKAQMRGKPLVGKAAQELKKVQDEIAELDQKIDAYEKSKQKPETKPEQKPEQKPEPVKEKVTELVGSTKEYREYGNYLIDQLVSKDPDGEKSRQVYIDGWNQVAKDKDSGSKANQFLEDILVGMLPADKKATGYADIRKAFMQYKPAEKTTEQPAAEKTEAKDDAAIKKRIEALDPNESQGYQIDRLRVAKEDMLKRPERAIMAMRAMDFFTEFYGRNDKQYIEYVKKHPLSTVTQYFYNSENSIYGMVTEQIAGKQFDIVRKEQQIAMLGKGKKDAGIKKSYEDDIQSAKKYIDDLITAYNKYAAENKYVPFNINGKVVPSTIGRDQNGRGDLKKIPYEFTLNQFSDKVKESIKNGTFKIEVEKSGTKAVAKFIKSGKVLKTVTLPDISKIKEANLQDYATDQLINAMHKDSVLLAVTVQDGDAISQFEQDIKMRRMSAQDAVQIISSANVEVPKGIQALADSEKEILQETAEPESKPETVEETPEVEQYKPLTSKDIEIGKFSKDEALDYETDEKELDSGRMSEYISSMTVDVMNEDGDSIGNLIKLKDEDGITTWQATDVDGNELTMDEFDTKQEAIQAILDSYNKQKGKEFAAEQKRKAKAEEKKAAKEAAKAEKAEPAVTPVLVEGIESTAESVTDSQMKMIDSIMETERTKPAKAKEMREQFIEQHGKEVFDKLNKITRNFEQIINTLEKEGKCTKRC
jgi:hypothetical protein